MTKKTNVKSFTQFTPVQVVQRLHNDLRSYVLVTSYGALLCEAPHSDDDSYWAKIDVSHTYEDARKFATPEEAFEATLSSSFPILAKGAEIFVVKVNAVISATLPEDHTFKNLRQKKALSKLSKAEIKVLGLEDLAEDRCVSSTLKAE